MESIKLKLSYFNTARDNQPKALEASWQELAESLQEARVAECTPETCKYQECTYKHGQAWSPASYPEGAPRARNTVQGVSVLVFDVDHLPTDERLAEIIGSIPYARIIHASHSDRPGDRCVRIIVQLTEPIPSALWPAFWKWAVDKFQVPADAQTKDASRIYFLPSRPQGSDQTEVGDGSDYLFAVLEGAPLDVGEFLASQVPGVEVAHSDVGVTPSPEHILTKSELKGRDRALEVLSQTWPAQGRHQASLSLAGALAHAKWDQESIAKFLHDLMDQVFGPGMDPAERKRDDQARDSVAKVERGEPVSGWPSLIPHIGEVAVAEVTQALGIGGKPLWLQNFLQKGPPQKPRHDQLVAHYKAVRKKLLRQTSSDAQLHARMIAKVLDHDQLAEAGEDRLNALGDGLRALVKYAPEETENDQIAQLLAHVFPVDVGQDNGRPWSDVLSELVEQCVETIAQEAQQHEDFEVETSGVRLGKPKVTLDNLEVALKKESVKFKYDEFATKKLISIQNTEYQVLQDEHIEGLWIDIEKKYDLSYSWDKFCKYLNTKAFKERFHPVRDYLDQLEWDGVPRIDQWLIRYGKAMDNDYTRAIGRIVLVAAVRRVRDPGCKFDEMMILEGEQGVRKSTALQALCPNKDWFTDAMELGSDSKKTIESSAGKFIIEVGELKGMSKKEVGDLKGFLSRCVDEARMAFGRETRISPRQFIMIGTTNDAQYLHDPTGNRRFWPVAVIEFDVDAILRDRDQLWAEAAHYEAKGESIRLDAKYYAIAAKEQEERRVIDTIEAIVEEAFEGHLGRVRALDVYQLLGKDSAEVRQDEQRRMSDAMRRVGWAYKKRRIHGKPTWVWVKGTEDEQHTALGITGRKVVKLAGAQPKPVPLGIPGLVAKP